MSDQAEPSAMQKARYEASVRALEFELDQFWKRSLFFWGFISVALAAFSAAHQHPLLQGIIASFGFVCSVIWTLANRGSKFWYENWETKRIAAEIYITGNLYGKPEQEKPEQEKRGLEKSEQKWLVKLRKWLVKWLKKRLMGKRYSPSGLTIVLSDYVVLLWFGLLVSKIIMICPCLQVCHHAKNCFAWFTCIFMALSIPYVILLGRSCHRKGEEESTSQQQS